MAAVLAARFSEDEILYDRYHEAEFARHRLGFHLQELYHKESDLIVTIFCDKYQERPWCGVEWDAINALLMDGREEIVLLSRFDYANVRGLYPGTGYCELDNKSPEQFSRLILERLALNEGRSKNYYSSHGAEALAEEWPEVPPQLDWPVADHLEAQEAFAQLLTRTSPFRLLAIYGATETGKSHLSKQFLRNAIRVPHLTCGRFDFKGSSDMNGELRTFADHLNLPLPAGGVTVSGQLSAIFYSLKSVARPTLLIFDTFEAAGEAERWMRENLLLSVVRASWIRVIIIGQRTPHAYGEPWAGSRYRSIELQLPRPEDWLAFGVTHKPNITIELVRDVYGLCNGKSTVLAQVFGPAI